ncbi:hypothetical protein KO465_05400 [Candidatus Micrarchaeota archaeon]|nr:hypothetical protein [Candidatus Micrarchaeota archaeon]
MGKKVFKTDPSPKPNKEITFRGMIKKRDDIPFPKSKATEVFLSRRINGLAIDICKIQSGLFEVAYEFPTSRFLVNKETVLIGYPNSKENYKLTEFLEETAKRIGTELDIRTDKKIIIIVKDGKKRQEFWQEMGELARELQLSTKPLDIALKEHDELLTEPGEIDEIYEELGEKFASIQKEMTKSAISQILFFDRKTD